MKNHLFILDENKNPIPIEDTLQWAKALTDEMRIVKQTRLNNAFISTVFLGINHQFIGQDDLPPILFETMIFNDPENPDYQERYCTYKEALEHHEQLVKQYKAKEQRPAGSQPNQTT